MRRLISLMSQECPKNGPSKPGFPKNPKKWEFWVYKTALIMQQRNTTDLSPDFSVRRKKIISRNSKMDIYKCPKMSKMQISWGLSNRGILYNIIRIVYKSTIVNLSFLQSCRGRNYKIIVKPRFLDIFKSEIS